jgi:DedD protein
MDQNTKQRLVGITVIFALAVIFLPMILDGSGVRKEVLTTDIPTQFVLEQSPQFDQKIIELQAKVEDLPSVQSGVIDEQSTIEPDASEPDQTNQAIAAAAIVTKKTAPVVTSETPKAKPVKAKPGGETWVLQVGSFEDHNKAIAQRDKLRKSNIAAVFVEKFEANSKPSYRVRLGPFTYRNLSKIAQNKVKAKHNIDGLIMKYEK